MTRLARALALLSFAPIFAGAQDAGPRNGAEVLERMRAAYDGKWYHTLAFAQKTTQYLPNGTKRIQSWRESLRHTGKGTQLRIDMGEISKGNGVLYTPDSSWRVQAGKLAGSNSDGNAFLPLIEGVYVQPVQKTIAELAPTKIDLTKAYVGSWKSKPAWIVGATSAADSVSPQFWVDPQQKVVVRFIVSFGGPDPYDVRLDDYVTAGGGMLATKVSMSVKGMPVQVEDYADWKVDVPLTDALFDTRTWIQP